MNFKSVFRFIHSTPSFYSVKNSPLYILRKKTGYTFDNIQKALALHQNDVVKAEQWLKEQAQALGWKKAMKVEGRITKQGLVGVIVENNIGAMVEVNCETDFVERNNTFQQFVLSASRACIQHVSKMPAKDPLFKVDFEAEGLKAMQGLGDRSLGDELALLIGSVGENASLRRATCYKGSAGITLAGYTHPAPDTNVGKYGSLVAYKSVEDSNTITALQRNICQHVVGMNPSKVGKPDADKPNADKDDEKCLIYQEYLLDPTVAVGELADENSLQIVDFARFQCGENIATIEETVNLATASN